MARYTRLMLLEREELSLRLSWGWSYRRIARAGSCTFHVCVVRRSAMACWYGTIGRRARNAKPPAGGGVAVSAGWTRTRVCGAAYFDACAGVGRRGRLRVACERCLRWTGVCACPMKPCTRTVCVDARCAGPIAVELPAPASQAASPAGPQRGSARSDTRHDQHRGTSDPYRRAYGAGPLESDLILGRHHRTALPVLSQRHRLQLGQSLPHA